MLLPVCCRCVCEAKTDKITEWTGSYVLRWGHEYPMSGKHALRLLYIYVLTKDALVKREDSQVTEAPHAGWTSVKTLTTGRQVLVPKKTREAKEWEKTGWLITLCGWLKLFLDPIWGRRTKTILYACVSITSATATMISSSMANLAVLHKSIPLCSLDLEILNA